MRAEAALFLLSLCLLILVGGAWIAVVSKRRRTVLVLDLDETLVHTGPDGTTRERPGVRAFLREMATLFDVAAFTAATRSYADPLLDRLDPSGAVFGTRLFRDSCDVMAGTGEMVKDLRRLGVPLDRVIIVDNTPSAYALQPENGVPIASWYGDPNDTALRDLAPRLRILAEK
jgi:Dullard-like phosphatase family protein